MRIIKTIYPQKTNWACRPKRRRREGGGAHRGVGMSPLVFWEIVDFPKHLQNIDNVLPYKCVANLYNPCVYHNKKRPEWALFIVVGAHGFEP